MKGKRRELRTAKFSNVAIPEPDKTIENVLCHCVYVCLGGSERNSNWTCLYNIYTTNTTVMNTCYYYLFVGPILAEYTDDGSIEPASFALVETESKVFRVSFFTTHNQLYMIRIEIPRVSDETIPESDLDIIQTIKEHVLSVLRLTYDHSVSISRTIYNFVEEGEKPSLHVRISEMINPNFDPHVENVRNVFVTTFPIRVQIGLLSDSQDKRLPLQYRYLSSYKLLEIEFKKKGSWISEFDDLVSSFKEEFKSLGIRMKPPKYIHCLRDRCAHITTGKDAVGITQLSNKDMVEIDRFLPLMTKICVSAIDKRHPDKGFSLVNYQTFSQEMKKREQQLQQKGVTNG
jgi:hypothetical protein